MDELNRLYEQMLFCYHEWAMKREITAKNGLPNHLWRAFEWQTYTKARDRYLAAMEAAQTADLH